MKVIVILFCVMAVAVPRLGAQEFSAVYTTEVQYDFKKKMNWCNLLRLEGTIDVGKYGTFDLATIHFYKTGKDRIADDLQTFSNIEEDNVPGAFAIMGYSVRIKNSVIFLGVRNLNEDYFTAPGMSLFTTSSYGIFSTLSCNYPIANYPLSVLCIDYILPIDKLDL